MQPVTPQCMCMGTRQGIFTGCSYIFSSSFPLKSSKHKAPNTKTPIQSPNKEKDHILQASCLVFMEAFKIKLFVVVAVLLVAISSNGVLQISNAQTICNVSVSGLMACKSAVTPPNPTTPSTDCCTALSHADLRCLCSYRNSNLLPSLGIDPNLAMQLPGKCKLPHAAHC